LKAAFDMKYKVCTEGLVSGWFQVPRSNDSLYMTVNCHGNK